MDSPEEMGAISQQTDLLCFQFLVLSRTKQDAWQNKRQASQTPGNTSTKQTRKQQQTRYEKCQQPKATKKY